MSNGRPGPACRLDQPGTGVIVTGGASGIGLASARALAAVGRAVALWDINAEKALAEAEVLATNFAVPATGFGIDLTDISAYDAAIAASREAIGPLGGLVHAAGIVDTGSGYNACHANMPPVRLRTCPKPACCKKPCAIPLRAPLRQ